MVSVFGMCILWTLLFFVNIFLNPQISTRFNPLMADKQDSFKAAYLRILSRPLRTQGPFQFTQAA